MIMGMQGCIKYYHIGGCQISWGDAHSWEKLNGVPDFLGCKISCDTDSMLNTRDLASGTRLSVWTTTSFFCAGERDHGVLDVSGESLAHFFLLVLFFDKRVDVIQVRRQPTKRTFNSAMVVCVLFSFSRSWKQLLHTGPCTSCILQWSNSWHRPSNAVVAHSEILCARYSLFLCQLFAVGNFTSAQVATQLLLSCSSHRWYQHWSCDVCMVSHTYLTPTFVP